MKILLIESDDRFARELEGALAGRGLAVAVTVDGRDAVEVARREQPDAVVLCVELAGMSGYSACNRLRKDPELRAVPLVITSAEATSETFEQHRKLKTRADGYLHKPFAPAALLDLLGTLIPLPAPAPDQAAAGAPRLDGSSEEDDFKLIDEAFDRVAPAGRSHPKGPPAAAVPTPVPPPGVAPSPAPALAPTAANAAAPSSAPPELPELELDLEVEPFAAPEPAPDSAGGAPEPFQVAELEELGARADEALASLTGAGEDSPPLDLASATALIDAGAEAGAVPATSDQESLEAARMWVGDLQDRLDAAEGRLEEAERARAKAEARVRELTARLSESEAARAQGEERVLRASRRLRSDELLRDRARKALAIALQLLEERPQAPAPAPEEVQRRRE